ncbi:MAG: glycosyltransferase [Bacilli bacterium]|nr:glycosyltransferase [Bacilli bacterium]
MRVVQINIVYGKGSTGRIVETLHHRYLESGIDSHVLFGRGPKGHDPLVRRTGFLLESKAWRFFERFTGDPYQGVPFGTANLKRHIRKLRPDLVHIHCINGNMCSVYSLLKWLKKNEYKTVITHHATFMFTGGCPLKKCDGNKTGCVSCPHASEFLPKGTPNKTARIFERWEDCGMGKAHHVFVSPWLRQMAEGSSFLRTADSHVIYNPMNLQVFHEPIHSDGPVGKPYVFFPSSLAGSKEKGSQWIEPLAALLTEKGICLVVTEGASSHRDNVIDVGPIVSPETMASYYGHAIATVLLSEVESFSMPVVESLCCGTPVVGFECGGPESLDTFGGAFLFPYGSIEKVAGKIVELQKNPLQIPYEKVHETYDADHVAKEYMALYEKLLRGE